MAENLFGRAFIPYYDYLMYVLRTHPELRRTAKGIFKKLACCTGGIIAGGIIGGPFGAMVGGFAGVLTSYIMRDDYQSLINALQALSDQEKAELVMRVQRLVGEASIEAFTRFIAVPLHCSALLALLRNFVKRG